MKRLFSVVTVGLIIAAAVSTNAAPAKTTVKPRAKLAEKVCPAPKTPAAPTKLEAGSPAPDLKVWKWLKGQPINRLEKGKVYVVELWATWCPPCRASIPHMTEMAAKYKGKISFLGVCVWDSTDRATRKPYSEKDYVDHVQKFVEEMGDKMDYNVGLDDMKGTVARKWGEAAQIPGIPTAFVVGKDGKILVITHPMSLDNVLEEIVSGKFDSKAYAKEQADEKAADDAFQQNVQGVYGLCQQKKYSEAIAESDRLIKLDARYEQQLDYAKFMCLLKTDEPAGYEFARKISESTYKEIEPALAAIALSIVIDNELKTPDYATAIAIAEKAAALPNGDKDTNVFEALACANSKLGKKDKAIELEQKAIDIANANPNYPQQAKDEMNKRLDEYKK